MYIVYIYVFQMFIHVNILIILMYFNINLQYTNTSTLIQLHYKELSIFQLLNSLHHIYCVQKLLLYLMQ
jgi:hypothetical protein